MNFRQIEAFRAVIAQGSVTRAAESLHISQPAVSRLIADLEADLKVVLFQRERGRLIPTAEAQLLYQEAAFAFAGLERLREAAVAIRGLRRGRIRMVAETVYVQGYLSRLAAAFQRLHPDVYLELDIGPSARIAEWVALTWYDVGLVVLPVIEPAVRVRSLQRQRALCALPADHILARQEVVRAAQLAGERFVSLTAGTPFRTAIDKVFVNLGIQRDIRIEARTQHALCTFVAEGAGVSIVDPWVAEDARDERIAFRRFEPEVTWDLGLIFPLSRPASLLTEHFAGFLAARCAGR